MRAAWIVVSLVVVGCVQTYATPTKGVAPKPATNPDSVQVLPGFPTRPFRVLGAVRVRGGAWASDDRLRSHFIKGAAALGADAIVVTGEQVDVSGVRVVQTGYLTTAAPAEYHDEWYGLAIAWTDSTRADSTAKATNKKPR